MSINQLKVAQFGQETTWGTAVAGTAKLMGLTEASLSIVPEHEHPEELGRIGPSALIALVEEHGEAALEVAATYEDLIYLQSMLFGAITPSGTGPYVWNGNGPVAAALTPDLFSIEFGMSGASYVLSGAICQKATISWEAGGTWQWKADILGNKVATVTLASLSDRTAELIRAADTVTYVDAWGGTIGSTALAGMVIGYELEIDTTQSLEVFGGSVNPTDYAQESYAATLKLTLKWNATTKAYIDALIGSGGTLTQRQIRTKATSGTKIAQLDFAGTLTNPDELYGDRQGRATVTLEFEGTYNSTLGNYLKTSVTNNVATLV